MNKSILPLLLTLFSLLLLGCGAQAAAEAPVVARNVEALDTLRFAPEQMSVPAGATVNLTLNNSGGLDHNFVLVANDADPLTVTAADALANAVTENVGAGGSATVRFAAPAAGSYRYVCTIPGHAAAGMVGELTVGE